MVAPLPTVELDDAGRASRAASAAIGAASDLLDIVPDDDRPTTCSAADQALGKLLVAVDLALAIAGVLPEETERAALRDAVTGYVGR